MCLFPSLNAPSFWSFYVVVLFVCRSLKARGEPSPQSAGRNQEQSASGFFDPWSKQRVPLIWGDPDPKGWLFTAIHPWGVGFGEGFVLGDLVEFRLELTGRLAVDDQRADRVALAREVGSLLSRADAIWCLERDGPGFCHRALDLHRRYSCFGFL